MVPETLPGKGAGGFGVRRISRSFTFAFRLPSPHHLTPPLTIPTPRMTNRSLPKLCLAAPVLASPTNRPFRLPASVQHCPGPLLPSRLPTANRDFPTPTTGRDHPDPAPHFPSDLPEPVLSPPIPARLPQPAQRQLCPTLNDGPPRIFSPHP